MVFESGTGAIERASNERLFPQRNPPSTGPRSTVP
ncbi:MAG: hypothetical protein RL021_1814, partial [Bacteroidota bacterium]